MQGGRQRVADVLTRAFKQVTHVPVTKSDARKVILKELSDAIRCKEPIAVHCSSVSGCVQSHGGASLGAHEHARPNTHRVKAGLGMC